MVSTPLVLSPSIVSPLERCSISGGFQISNISIDVEIGNVVVIISLFISDVVVSVLLLVFFSDVNPVQDPNIDSGWWT